MVDLESDSAEIDTADYAQRLVFLNMAQQEWAETYDWSVLFKRYGVLVSTSTGNASIALPADFRKLAAEVAIVHDNATDGFFENRPPEGTRYHHDERRVEILGNPQEGYTLRVYGVDLASGASVSVPYYSVPTSLSTSSQVSPVPNPDYLVKRAIAYWWESREDPRFPQMKQDAERILSNMIEYENVFGEGSSADRVRTVEETRYNFRMGRD